MPNSNVSSPKSEVPAANSHPTLSGGRNRSPASALANVSYLVGFDDNPCVELLAAVTPNFLIRISTVCLITGLSVPTIYREMNKKNFPRPVKITSAARAWKLREIAAWVDSRERGKTV